MNTDFDRLQKAKSLRDIFLSHDSGSLAEAFVQLQTQYSISEMELETQFNRYFIGPDTPIAPPYASIYLDEEDALMTQTTMKIRDLYSIMGFKNTLKDKVPEDFLGLELDAYYQLLFIEIEKDIPYLKELRMYFLCEHINTWIFKFIEQVSQHKKESSTAVNCIIEELKHFFQNELTLKGEIS